MSPSHPAAEWTVTGARAGDASLLLRLISGTPREIPRLIIALAVQLASAGLMLVTPVILQRAIDGPIASRDTAGLLGFAGLYLAVLAAIFASSWLREYLMETTGERIINYWRCKIFSHLLRLPVPFFDRHRIGSLITRATNDVEVLNDFFSSGAVSLARDALTLFGIMLAMFLYHPVLSALSFTVIPPLVAMAYLFNRLVRGYFRETRAKLAALNGNYQEALAGLEALKAFEGEEYRRERFRGINRDYLGVYLKTIVTHALFYPGIQILNAVAWALVAWYGGRQVVAGVLSAGILAAFIEYIRMFFRPIVDLSQQFDTVQSALAAAERIFSILDHPLEGSAGRTLPPPPAASRGIEFRDVWFGYREEEWVLRGVSFTIAPGERVALIGQTGAGKSSIIHLLNRFYEPQRGEILLGGVPIPRWDLSDLRRSVGLVSQDVVLFPGTILENLRRVRPELSPVEAEALFSSLGIEDILGRFPKGIDTPLAGEGRNLSAGERQILSFVRALAVDPPILVMDEATSRIDPDTEEMIRRATTRLLAARTSIVIAHRLTTIRQARRVIVIHAGTVAEDGAPEVLERGAGLYRAYLDLAALLFDTATPGPNGSRAEAPPAGGEGAADEPPASW